MSQPTWPVDTAIACKIFVSRVSCQNHLHKILRHSCDVVCWNGGGIGKWFVEVPYELIKDVNGIGPHHKFMVFRSQIVLK